MRKTIPRILLLLITLLMPATMHAQEPLFPKETRLYYGFQIKEGFNWLLCETENDDEKFIVGRRYHPFFSVYFDLGQWYEHNDEFSGATFEIQYAWRGGKVSSYNVELMLDYLDLRLGYSWRSNGQGFFRAGMELSLLQNAAYGMAEYPQSDVIDFVAKKALGVWFEGGGRIGKHFTMNFYFDWLCYGFWDNGDDLLGDYFWGATDDQNIMLGMAIGWLFSPMKISSNKRYK